MCTWSVFNYCVVIGYCGRFVGVEVIILDVLGRFLRLAWEVCRGSWRLTVLGLLAGVLSGDVVVCSTTTSPSATSSAPLVRVAVGRRLVDAIYHIGLVVPLCRVQQPVVLLTAWSFISFNAASSAAVPWFGRGVLG